MAGMLNCLHEGILSSENSLKFQEECKGIGKGKAIVMMILEVSLYYHRP